jgi:uncharacterized protein (DUF342 family)
MNMDRITITKTPDGLKAFIMVPESRVVNYPSVEELKQVLADSEVVYGINESALQQMVMNKTYRVCIEAATGMSPTPAKPGRIDILVDISSRGKPRALPGGRVDLRDIGYIVNVRKNTQLLRSIPSVPGIQGKMVSGKTLSVLLPPSVLLVPGNGTRFLDQERNVLVADIDGAVVVYTNGKAEVLTEKVVPGSIDYSTGNIFFSGNLKIEGTVRSGFAVEAEGNILIGGSVEDAKVSALADVDIVGGAAGSNNGVIKCGGTLKTRHIQNFSVQAQHVVVSEDLVHCDIWAEATIIAKTIVGGTVSAGTSIDADSVGTVAEAKTVVDLGGMTVLLKQKSGLLRNIMTVTAEIGNLKGTIFSLVCDEMDENGELPEASFVRLNNLKKKNCELIDKNAWIQKDIESLDEKLKSRITPMLRARTVFPNTVVKTGKMEKTIKEKLVNVVITAENDEIVVKRG